jgi:hypothetical protein
LTKKPTNICENIKLAQAKNSIITNDAERKENYVKQKLNIINKGPANA